MPRTWRDIHRMILAAGVKPSDRIFMIDIGPNCERVFITRDEVGVEISEDESIVKNGNKE